MNRKAAFLILVAMVQSVGAEEINFSDSLESLLVTEYEIRAENPHNEDVFEIVVIGDSVAWGTGLRINEKYSYLVANWLKTRLYKTVHVKILARPGATIEHSSCDSASPADYSTEFYSPELSNIKPTLMEQADMIPNPKDVDLILVSGGANDVNLEKTLMLDYGIFNEIGFGCKKLVIGSNVEDIRKRSQDVQPSMYKLLIKLMTICPNANVIVTGYYAGVSRYSKGMTSVVAAVRPDSQNPITKGYQKLDEKPQKDQLIEKSIVFTRAINESLSKAVNSTNAAMNAANQRELPYHRAVFVPIFFPPERSYGTNQSWLWKLESIEGQIRTNDNAFEDRLSLLKDMDTYCECEACSSETINQTLAGSSNGIDCNIFRRNKFGAVGHPNVDGAKNYSDSIIREMNNSWTIWLNAN